MSQSFWLAFCEPTGGENGGPDAGGEAAPDRRAEYERLIRGDFKDLYTEDTQRIVNRRFKGFKERLEESERVIAELKAPPMPDLTGQAAALREEFPDFDLEAELKDPLFEALARGGLPLADCRRAVHLTDIIEKAASEAREEAEREFIRRARLKAIRPAENGMTTRGGSVVKNDASRLTRQQRADMAERALRGERVYI